MDGILPRTAQRHFTFVASPERSPAGPFVQRSANPVAPRLKHRPGCRRGFVFRDLFVEHLPTRKPFRRKLPFLVGQVHGPEERVEFHMHLA
jgi:hypothetical protein